MTVDEALRQAVQFHSENRLPEAERLYRAILQVVPTHPDANHNLGIMAVQHNNLGAALCHFKAAIDANKEQEQYWISYIDALLRSGQTKTARLVLDEAARTGFLAAQFKLLECRLLACSSQENPETKPQKPGPGRDEINALLELYRAGRYLEAEKVARGLMKIYPNDGFAWKVLGAVLQALGRPAEALETMRYTTSIFPQDAEASYNLGVILHDLGRFQEAELAYGKAISLKPGHAQSFNNLGNTLIALGRQADAEVCYRRALALKPNYAEAYNNLGNLLKDKGTLPEAELCYRRALDAKSNFIEALNNLARIYAIQGSPEVALSFIVKSLEVQERHEAKTLFVGCLKHLQFESISPSLREMIAKAFSEPWGRPADYARTGAGIIIQHPVIGTCVHRSANAWPLRLAAPQLFVSNDELDAVITDNLLLAVMESAPICSQLLERFLSSLREILLSDLIDSDGVLCRRASVLRFCCALARQCFINEYVFALSESEKEKIEALKRKVISALSKGDDIPPVLPIMISSYMPLSAIDSAGRLLDRVWPQAVQEVINQQVCDPQTEAKLRHTIPQLTPIDGDVTLKVRQQYEENPYPRWERMAVSSTPMSIDAMLYRKFPLSKFKPLGIAGNVDVLIAGCGTGQQSLDTARNMLSARVLAIDLSLTSLGYAKRKTIELGHSNIEYAQADIMRLSSLGRTFDVIESAGVLHHLADLLAGWRILLSLLRPGGVMYVALYSATARRFVDKARKYFAEQNSPSTLDEIRNARQVLMEAGKNANFGPIMETGDFFSASACRDLLFHVQEHRVKTSDIDRFIRENHLVFLGFETDENTTYRYKERFPEDLSATNLSCWEIFEAENPDTFFGMYHFWIQKRSSN